MQNGRLLLEYSLQEASVRIFLVLWFDRSIASAIPTPARSEAPAAILIVFINSLLSMIRFTLSFDITKLACLSRGIVTHIIDITTSITDFCRRRCFLREEIDYLCNNQLFMSLCPMS